MPVARPRSAAVMKPRIPACGRICAAMRATNSASLSGRSLCANARNSNGSSSSDIGPLLARLIGMQQSAQTLSAAADMRLDGPERERRGRADLAMAHSFTVGEHYAQPLIGCEARERLVEIEPLDHGGGDQGRRCLLERLSGRGSGYLAPVGEPGVDRQSPQPGPVGGHGFEQIG